MTTAPSGIGPGRHDAIVVDASWQGDALLIELAVTSGVAKGTVVGVPLPAGSPAAAAALTTLGYVGSAGDAQPGDPNVPLQLLGMPCTLVVAYDDDGRSGFAVEP